jgi:hypothetical protein
MEQRWNDIDRGRPENSEINFPRATLSIISPTSTALGAKPVLRGEKQATNSLNHGTADILK